MKRVLLLITILASYESDARIFCDRFLSKYFKPRNLFDRSSFLQELQNHKFVDNLGDSFNFMRDGREGYISSSIDHSTIGKVYADISNFEGRFIDSQGNLNWHDSYTNYKDYQDRGFTSSLFEFLKDRTPIGSYFILADSTSSSSLRKTIMSFNEKPLKVFIEDDPVVAKLWDFFNQFKDNPKIKKSFLSPYLGEKIDLENTSLSTLAFKRYLLDISTQWGRIARKGNYRTNYFSLSRNSVLTFFKYDLDDMTILKESQLLSSLEDNYGLLGNYLRNLFDD